MDMRKRGVCEVNHSGRKRELMCRKCLVGNKSSTIKASDSKALGKSVLG